MKLFCLDWQSRLAVSAGFATLSVCLLDVPCVLVAKCSLGRVAGAAKRGPHPFRARR